MNAHHYRNLRHSPSLLSGRKGSFCIVLIFLAIDAFLPSEAMAEERLRSNRNDGANAAALLSGILFVEKAPGNEGGGDSASSLRDIQLQLEACGVATRARILGYQELVSCNLPCVVPLRFASNEDASFCVLIQADASEVYVVEAGPLNARMMSVDDFRRHWTGHAVFGKVAGARYGYRLALVSLGIGLPLFCFGLHSYFRRRRRLPNEAT